MKKFVTSLILAMAFTFPLRGGSVGGIGGGGGAVQVSDSAMMDLQRGALNGDLIRVTKPGADPIYLRPDLGSMNIHSFRANALPSGEETVFYSELPTENIQIQIALRVARSVKAPIGSLPVIQSDFEVTPQIVIDAVPVTDIDEHTLNRTNRSAFEVSIPQ